VLYEVAYWICKLTEKDYEGTDLPELVEKKYQIDTTDKFWEHLLEIVNKWKEEVSSI
jgi:hypothetical protein